MRFQIIMEKTLGDLMNPKRILALTLLSTSLTTLLVYALSNGGNMSLEKKTQTVLDYFTIFVFMWTSGVFLALTVATTAAGFVAREHDEGTLLLLVSKPINRFEIILGKFLALILSSIIIQAISLFLCVVALWLIMSLDSYTVSALLGLLPWVLLYSILVILVFSSLALALSTLWRSRVKIMLVLTVIIMMTFFIGIIPRAVFSDMYESYYLAYPDLGYHLGNAYILLLSQSDEWRMIPSNQLIMAVFSGVYPFSVEGSFDPDISAWPSSLEMSGYVYPILSLLMWIVVSAGAIGLGAVAMKRKEVY